MPILRGDGISTKQPPEPKSEDWPASRTYLKGEFPLALRTLPAETLAVLVFQAN
jgi:hypothetical protein